jgi:hypothetical protein
LRAAEPKLLGIAGRNAQLIPRALLWMLTPAAAVAAVGFSLLFMEQWNWPRAALCVVFAVATLCLVLAWSSQERYWWAPRVLAGLVTLGYLGAVVRFSWFPAPGAPGPHLPLLFLATVGFMVCGVPSLSFMLWGHTRGKLARGDVQRITLMDRWTARLIPVLAYGTWFAVGVYLLSLLVY